MIIVPAIYPEVFEEVVDKLYALVGVTKFVQIIVCDGKYGMRRSWDPSGILPDNFDYEFDLQLTPWKEYMVKTCRMSAKSIVVHIDEFTDEDYDELFKVAQMYHCRVGLCVSNDSSVDILVRAVHKVEASQLFLESGKVFIQVSGVNNLNGDYYHFDERVLNRIRVLKKLFPTYQIQVAGRINPDTAGSIKQAGADRLVSSSYIFGHENVVEAIDNLLHAVQVVTVAPEQREVKEVKPEALPIVSTFNNNTEALVVMPPKKAKRPMGKKYKASTDELVYESEDDTFLKD